MRCCCRSYYIWILQRSFKFILKKMTHIFSKNSLHIFCHHSSSFTIITEMFSLPRCIPFSPAYRCSGSMSLNGFCAPSSIEACDICRTFFCLCCFLKELRESSNRCYYIWLMQLMSLSVPCCSSSLNGARREIIFSINFHRLTESVEGKS